MGKPCSRFDGNHCGKHGGGVGSYAGAGNRDEEGATPVITMTPRTIVAPNPKSILIVGWNFAMAGGRDELDCPRLVRASSAHLEGPNILAHAAQAPPYRPDSPYSSYFVIPRPSH